MKRDVFQAISDPTRREIIRLLSIESMNLNTIADNFQISRPAISKQVKILSECGIVTIRDEGRERFCSVKLEKLKEVSNWINYFEQFWDNKLDALELHLSKNNDNNKQNTK